jgi:ribonuclease P/MRP protein subunit POP7
MSAVKRVRRLLREIDKRATQSVISKNTSSSHHNRRFHGDKILAAAIADSERSGDGKAGEEVLIKATGRAIQKAVNLAEFFKQSDNLRVRMKTGSLWAIDDVVKNSEDEMEDDSSDEKEGKLDSSTNAKDGETEPGEEDKDSEGEAPRLDSGFEDKEEDVPETRVRQISVMEVAVSLR